jgi:hypothetical protein
MNLDAGYQPTASKRPVPNSMFIGGTTYASIARDYGKVQATKTQ